MSKKQARRSAQANTIPVWQKPDFWQALDENTTRKKGKEAERPREQAVEWLRLETLQRKHADVFRVLDANELTDDQRERAWDSDLLLRQLQRIRRGEHHWLIGVGKPPPLRHFPFHTQKIKRARAARLLTAGTWYVAHEHSAEIDLGQKDEIILAAIHRLRAQATGQRRAAGGGPEGSLKKMWEGLLLADHEHDAKELERLCKELGLDSRDKLDRRKLYQRMLKHAPDPPRFLNEFL